MKMSAPFYIANAAATANVVTSSASNAMPVILPAAAVVTGVLINTTGTGNVNVGFTPLSGVGPGQITTLGTPVPTGFLANQAVTARTSLNVASAAAGANMGAVANATNLVVVTSAANGSASGTVSGWIEYFVADTALEEPSI
jgi:hypothetical protein